MKTQGTRLGPLICHKCSPHLALRRESGDKGFGHQKVRVILKAGGSMLNLKKVFQASLILFVSLTFLSCSDVKFATSKSQAPTGPTPPPSPPTPQGTRDVTYTGTVQAQNNKLDILLIVDDSNSMLADNQKLATRLAEFVTNLQSSSIDWQMCATVTRSLPINGNPAWGLSIIWSNYTPTSSSTPNWVLKSTANLSTIFTNTINNIGAGWAGTDDERGTKAAYWHIYNGDPRVATASKCHRTDAALAMIIVSDEDVRSVGGEKAYEYYLGEHKPLENDDEPNTVLNYVKEVFGATKRFTFNSIIVKPNDETCLRAQDAGGAKSHYGIKYSQLSNMTGGGIGSICDENYSTNLNLFTDSIEDSLSFQALECMPVGTVDVTVTPPVTNLVTSVKGASLEFNPKIPVGRTLNIKYKCQL